MSFVSHAQNFEDVMLWRALRDVDDGFYIDIGAADPEDLSVTHAFTLRGWRGINVEPSETYFRKLERERPKDINICAILGREPGHGNFFLVDGGNGWSTTSEELASRYQAEGLQVVAIQVPVTTLAAICREHVSGPIHFLKIDVEGAERAVLEGMDFHAYRPWIVVVEATVPNSPVQNHLEWENGVLHAGYHFVYFDGLNRFYVADEHRERLDEAFAAPPNFFDNFVTAGQADAKQRADDAEAGKREIDLRREEAETRALRYEEQLTAAMASLDSVRRSKFWILWQALQRVFGGKRHSVDVQEQPSAKPWLVADSAGYLYRALTALAIPIAERVRTFLLADVQRQLAALQRQQFSERSELERSVEAALMTVVLDHQRQVRQ